MHAIKLTNPPNEELNIAFALKVAGWKFSDPEVGSFLVDPKDGLIRNPPDFCSDANAVLVWLEKQKYWSSISHRGKTGIAINPNDDLNDGDSEWILSGEHDSFTRAAVIALLRAHGVEIEFTAT